ncbi:MAG: phasin family protein [Rhizobacter sp.]|jgi:poly(hydroxyalkanoate) granule-associated protein
MVKKVTSRAASPLEAAAGLFDNPLAGTIKDSAQQIWLAGLGAFSKAQEEGGRVFDALVQEGVSLQRKTQSAAGEKLGAVSAQVSARMAEVGQKVEEASAKATGQWDRLETIFEERVAKALAQLGMPHASEVRELSAKVDQLSAQVAKLTAASSRPARKATVTRPVVKPVKSTLKPRVTKT